MEQAGGAYFGDRVSVFGMLRRGQDSDNGMWGQVLSVVAFASISEGMKHATIQREGYAVPLIGVPADAVIETCDCCGLWAGLREIEWNGVQMLCLGCRSAWRSVVLEEAGILGGGRNKSVA